MYSIYLSIAIKFSSEKSSLRWFKLDLFALHTDGLSLGQAATLLNSEITVAILITPVEIHMFETLYWLLLGLLKIMIDCMRDHDV